VPEEPYAIPLGQADIKREGTDITVIATSIMVHRALEAAETLSREGISVEVLDPRTLVPLDEESIVQSVKKTGRVLIVHEAVKRGGFGGEIAGVIAESEAFDYLDAPIRRLGGAAVPIPYNPVLERAAVPQVEDIVQAVRELVHKRF
jgi:pyruvate dehydrogenase E1 component beta subunit